MRTISGHMRFIVNKHILVISLAVQLAALTGKSTDEITAQASESAQLNGGFIIDILRSMIDDEIRRRHHLDATG